MVDARQFNSKRQIAGYSAALALQEEYVARYGWPREWGWGGGIHYGLKPRLQRLRDALGALAEQHPGLRGEAEAGVPGGLQDLWRRTYAEVRRLHQDGTGLVAHFVLPDSATVQGSDAGKVSKVGDA